MKVKHLVTNELIEAVVERVTSIDFKLILKEKTRFKWFNWNSYKQHEVYKLRAEENNKILGLMAIVDHIDPGIDAIEIELLEVSFENTGANKEVDDIAGCLIAYACRESFKEGMKDGYF
ncbi:hypothetical protein MKQ68_07100 [Chitinophaga horti]|uniref:N-acetyltransferase n=1 Tax=Chitinophaga horti TaxID=2920382 RepID=A0ABY6J5G8_9BACT|nr:hypothetical protein [Chitinophaga horti]UYQ94858.1 hypothetical protein MKQ68_07100 [Chitinophaga horti]